MHELTIEGNVYQINFGMGFLRRVNKTVKKPVDGLKDVTENIGLRMMLAGIVDEDPETLVDLLYAANEGQTPRLTKDLLDKHIDNPDTDISELFEEVKSFLSKTNATKKEMERLLAARKKQKEMEAKLADLGF